MEHRPLGNTGLELPVLKFCASSLGQEFRKVDLNQALESVHVALDLGMNFIDTSPFYGRGMSEVLLGVALWVCREIRIFLAPSSAATIWPISISRPGGSSKASTSACIGWAWTTWTFAFATTLSSWTCRRSSRKRCRPCARFNSRARFASSASAAIR